MRTSLKVRRRPTNMNTSIIFTLVVTFSVADTPSSLGLKGQCHEIFCSWFFFVNQFPPSPRVSLIVFLRPYNSQTIEETIVEVTRLVWPLCTCAIQSAKIHAHFHNVSIFVKGSEFSGQFRIFRAV